MQPSSLSSKILVVGPAWVGDMVMAQSLFMLLKQQHPSIVIDVLAPSSTQALLSRMPEVNDVIVMPFKHGEFNLKGRWALAKSLRAKSYSQAIVLSNTFKAALITWFARIPVRTGWRREMRQWILNDCRTLVPEKYPLMIERFMALGLVHHALLTKPYPFPRLIVKSQEVSSTLDKLQLTVNASQRILALCPGAEFGPSKRWPEYYYAEVANEKLSQGWQVWLFGGPNDKAVSDDIMRLTNNRCQNTTGRTTLTEAIDCLSCVDAVVTNDSGLMHVAAALNKPLVAIYGSSSPAYTPPLNEKALIVSLGIECSPCFQRVCPLGHWKCMLDLKPQQVMSALARVCA